jgi:glycine/D-amino acid oxidase-like deaminating enzyme
MLQNKFFKNLPLKELKGEVMTIKTEKALNRIYNRGVYVIQSGELNYKIGATYDLVNLGEGVTESGKNELIQKAKDLLKVPFKVAHQDWGIRPSTIDRRPLIGEHPNYKNILIFNGLGTKGVSLAPYFSEQLAKYLLGEGDLDKEANINRVKSLYSKFQ